MDFKSLQYVLKIVQTGSITSAAEELYMTQPALSHYISRLEKEEGFKIFDRSTTPISLTFAGEKYVAAIRQILEVNEQLNEELSNIREHKTGRLTIGIPPMRAAAVLPKILPEFLRYYPGVEVRTIEGNAEELKENLRRGSADLIILPHPDKISEFRAIEICREELFAVTRRGYLSPEDYTVDAQGRKILKIERMKDRPFLLLKQGHANREMLDVIFRLHDMTPKIFMETDTTNTAYTLASAGLGIAVVPNYALDSILPVQPTDCYKLSAEGLKWTISALFNPEGSPSYLGKQFVLIAKDVYAAEPDPASPEGHKKSAGETGAGK